MRLFSRRIALAGGPLLAAATFTAGAAPALAAPPRFSDVPAGTQFEREISWMASQGVTTGYPDGTFRPLGTVKRDAMAAFLYRLAGKPPYTPPAASPFTDIRPGVQFYPEMCWLAESGISTGYPDRTFRPLGDVNRDAMAAFLYRLAGSPEFTAPKTSPFTDIRPGVQFYAEMCWLAQSKISTGWPDRTYRPLQPVARDAMSAFMYRLNTAQRAEWLDQPTQAQLEAVPTTPIMDLGPDFSHALGTVRAASAFSFSMYAYAWPEVEDGQIWAPAVVPGGTRIVVDLWSESADAAALFGSPKITTATDANGKVVRGVTLATAGTTWTIDVPSGFASPLEVAFECRTPASIPPGADGGEFVGEASITTITHPDARFRPWARGDYDSDGSIFVRFRP